MKSEMKKPRDRDREVKCSKNSRELSRNETLAGYWKTLPKALKFKPSFVVFVLMERFQNEKNGSGRVGRHYIVGKYVVAKVSFTGGRVDVQLIFLCNFVYFFWKF